MGFDRQHAIRRQAFPWLALLALVLSMPVAVAAQESVVNVYSARKEALILPLLERFTEQTAVTVNLVTGKADALLKRLELEGEASPADVLITVDVGRLHRARQAGVLQPIESDILTARIPAGLRDAEGHWFGLSQRARTVFYVKERVSPEALSTYLSLGDPRWRGRVCVRSSSNVYNQSLAAAMIEAHGPERTELWAKSLVGNFARPPSGGDTDQLRAAAAGVCDLAIANTYYFGRLADSETPADRAVAAKLGVFWPNQGPDGRGAHVNVSGAGVAAWSKNRDNAIALIEFFTTGDVQRWYAEVNIEYPVVTGVAHSDLLASFGAFTADAIPLEKLGENNRAAVELMDRAGWK